MEGWRDVLLSLDAAWRDLVLPEPDMLDFVDSQWEALTSLKSQLCVCVGGSGKRWGRSRRRGGRENWGWYVK